MLRYSNVYGPNQEDGVVSKLIRNALLSKPFVIYGDGNQTRDFVYVKDIASANIKSIKNGRNKVININSSIDTSINSLVKLVSEQMDLKLTPVYLPPISGEIKHSILDNFVAKNSLDWTPS
ncbi:NAD-dependent epimerase/dehydratase family protein [Guptibacillus hwajinpoensis]|uniref:NAD-dependent epimerase/dehydratase family protein n=1 Tax=Guptibacillus hwajinpoensis TaxID=208199 RepID=UPI001CD33EA5|nr:NAD-dependent epimerase/dehydratase family protein [Pseudalkalibacillus hwajinpoensis]